MTAAKQSERRPRPWLAILITVVLLAMAVQSQLETQHVDKELIAALVLLAFYWAGQGVDSFFPFR